MGRILAFMQTEDGAVNRASLEALQGARELASAQGQTVAAVVFGSNTAPEQLIPLAIDEILVVPNSELADYSADYYVTAMAGLVTAENPVLLTAAHTYQAREWLPRLAARLGKPLVSDCLGPADDTGHTWTRPALTGGMTWAAVPRQSGPWSLTFLPLWRDMSGMRNSGNRGDRSISPGPSG